jgi:hypothetical protein
LQAEAERLRGDAGSMVAVLRLAVKALVLLHEAHHENQSKHSLEVTHG